MNGINVTITDMMNCRDRCVSIQNELISKYDKPVLSFCMNIPGPVKTNEQIRKAFDSGKAELLKATSAIDKAASKGIYHKNTASRKISRMNLAVNKMA